MLLSSTRVMRSVPTISSQLTTAIINANAAARFELVSPRARVSAGRESLCHRDHSGTTAALSVIARFHDGPNETVCTDGSCIKVYDVTAEVAADLQIHPQTVSYRIRQLRDMLGDDLDDPGARFELHLALADRSSRSQVSPQE